MVVELLGHERGARHEPECLVEVAEHEGLADGITFLALAPAGKLRDGALGGIACNFLRHRSPSSLDTIWTRLNVAPPLVKPSRYAYLINARPTRGFPMSWSL